MLHQFDADDDLIATHPDVVSITTTAVSDNNTQWQHLGLCREVDPDLFFPERGAIDTNLKAKKVCAGCPVRKQCLDYALTEGMRYGVWGGTSETERRVLRGEIRDGVDIDSLDGAA